MLNCGRRTKISAAPNPMNKENFNPDDARFGALLRASRPSPSLPPRFHEGVWRRIEDAAAPAKPESWLDALAVLVLRPRYAYATVMALVLVGALLGAREGNQMAKQDAQARYLAVEAPNALR